MFATILVDGYKVFVEGKLERLPDNVVVLDAAIKLCQCEIVLRKNIGKPGVDPAVSESSFFNSLKMFPSLANLSSSNTATTVASSNTKADEPIVVPAVTTPSSSSLPAATLPSLTSASTFAVPSVAPSTATSNFNSSYSRPRGRPPGSKNSLSKSLDWTQSKISPASIAAAMLGIYSNPSVPSMYSNPAQVSALLEECYKLQASISPTSRLSALDNVNASSSIFPLPPKSFSSTATSKFSKYENAKSSVPSSSTSVAPNPTSTVISVGSGQLTITPSSYTSSSKASKNSLNSDGVDFDIESVIPKSELLTNKMFSEMAGGVNKRKTSMHPPIGSNMAIPKDLPKSLTITPTPAGYSAGYSGKPIASNVPHVTLHPEQKKQKKAHKRSTTVPTNFGRVPTNFPSTKTSGQYGDLSGYQQLLSMNNMMSMMSRNLVPNTMHKTETTATPYHQSSNSKPKTQSSSNKKVQRSSFPMRPKNIITDAQMLAMASSSSRNFQPTATAYRGGNQSTNKNQQAAHRNDASPLKFGTTPMTAHSPNKSPVLPPPIARQPSPAMHPVRYCILTSIEFAFVDLKNLTEIEIEFFLIFSAAPKRRYNRNLLSSVKNRFNRSLRNKNKNRIEISP